MAGLDNRTSVSVATFLADGKKMMHKTNALANFKPVNASICSVDGDHNLHSIHIAGTQSEVS